MPVIDCEFECFTCSQWLNFGPPPVGFGFGFGNLLQITLVKAFISPLTPTNCTRHHGCNHSKQNPRRCYSSSKPFTLRSIDCELAHENTVSLLNECNAHECWLKWEMMPRCSAQSPGLEISIWVMAHKHLPNCVQPSTGKTSEVMKVIRFIQVGALSCVCMLLYNLCKWKEDLRVL